MINTIIEVIQWGMLFILLKSQRGIESKLESNRSDTAALTNMYADLMDRFRSLLK